MVKSEITPDLDATLDILAAECAGLQDQWWVFGSAAMALAGVPNLFPPDVDLIVSERDARHLVTAWNADVETGAGSPIFRSQIFAKAQVAPLPIEIIAGFEAQQDGAWSAVRPATRLAIERLGGTVFIPAVAEQAQICRRFGRPKDLARLAALEALI
ncbi:MAG TPA: hypothetical protein VM471_03685 [Phenylobacterium sp.]|nr:hypothetical protein [Phenylobacterium sp.]